VRLVEEAAGGSAPAAMTEGGAMKRSFVHVRRWLAVVPSVFSFAALGQSGDAELAQELTNPLADLVTVPIQMNFDRRLGPADDGTKVTTNVQPVIPFKGPGNWNLISRTIVPVVYQDEIVPGAGSQFGLGDINLTVFLSPKQPSAGGFLWGAGPTFLFPTATDAMLGARKWGAGPAVVGLVMRGPWTAGLLANHIWSFAGDDKRQDISNTFAQPFVAYTWPSAWTVSVQSETSYNWKSEKWSVPINAALSKLVRFGKLPVSLQGGVGYWAEATDAGPKGVRFRLQANIVLPR